uniref:Putative GDP-mannose 4,6-dehydratase n=1 Tax=viral metagenome TaxID=1070528 RepID=A0A6M3MEA2_9ZZZZ
MGWRDILITGTTGFIGSELLPLLKDRGYRVFSLERYVTGRMGKIRSPTDDLWFADLKDVFSLTKVIQKIQPDIVIHLGAITSVGYSYQHPQEVLETNFIGTVNLAELCRKYVPNFQQFIFASTAETYGVCEELDKREDTTNLIPNSPYAVSKYSCEKYLQYLQKAYNLPVTIFRMFNSYGRKRDKFFVVEKTIDQMLHGETCYLGDPEPVRDFLHYTDQLNAYLAALENPDAIGEIFNVSSGVGVSIKELSDKVAELTEFKGDVVWRSMPRRPLDIMHLVGSNEKIHRVLDVPEPVSLDEGLMKTIDWWRNIEV